MPLHRCPRIAATSHSAEPTGVDKIANRPFGRFDDAVPAYDVIVLGLGGMGSAAAFHLAARGQKTLGLEQFQPPHNQGSSHGSTRVIRQAYFEDPAYVPLLLRAYALWNNLERESARQLLVLCGGLMMGAPDSEVVRGSLRSAIQHDLSHELLDAREIRRRFPPFRISDDTVALFEQAAGLVYCEEAIRAHLGAAARAGAELHFQEPALSWQATPNGVEVVTPKGRYSAGRLVITAGPWAPQVLHDLALPLTVERQVLFWFEPRTGLAPFHPDRFPIYIWQKSEHCTPYGFPAVDGPKGGVKIALYRSPEIEVCTPQTVRREVDSRDEADLRSVLQDFLPDLDGPMVQASTCLYTLTPDLNFFVDHHPQHPQVTIAAGFSGHGFKFCSVMGEVVADLATRGSSPFDLGLFRLARWLGASK